MKARGGFLLLLIAGVTVGCQDDYDTACANNATACEQVDAPREVDADVDASIDSRVDSADGVSDIRVETDAADAPPTCTPDAPGVDCTDGETRTVVGSCSKAGQVKQQACLACKWQPATCVYKKGWRSIAAPPTAFTPRYLHGAVWTGSEMIVVGGLDSGGVQLADAARYNPDLDAWTPATAPPASPPAGTVSAVWSGSEMYTWGLTADTPVKNSASRYSPATNSWTILPSYPGSLRYFSQVGWSNATSEFFVWGGEFSAVCASDGWMYNPTSGTWSALPSSPLAARSHAVVVSLPDKILVWGGDCNGTKFGDGATYDPSLHTWTALPAKPIEFDPRREVAHASNKNNVFIFGGWDGGVTIYTDAISFAFGGGWSTFPKLDATVVPGPDRLDSQMWADDTGFWVWSGQSGGGTCRPGGARMNAATSTWSTMDITGEPIARSNASAIWTGNFAVIWGGLGCPSTALGDGAAFTP